MRMLVLVGVRNGMLAGISQNGPQAQFSFQSPTQFIISKANSLNKITHRLILRKCPINSNVIG